MSCTAIKMALPDCDAVAAGLLFAVDPHGLGGVVLRGLHGPVRERWLAGVRQLLPVATPWHKIPVGVSHDRLLGGLDFAATIGSGRPVFATGLLEAADDGVLVLSMAERIGGTTAAILGSALDQGTVRIERDGVARTRSSRCGMIALDEGIDDDEQVAVALRERLAFHVLLDDYHPGEIDFAGWGPCQISKARDALPDITIGEPVIEQLCNAAAAFGIPSVRAELLSLRAARAAAALFGYSQVTDEHAALAARLVLPQRALCMPETDTNANQPQPEKPESAADETPPPSADSASTPEDIVVDAVRAALPPQLLELLQRQVGVQRRKAAAGRDGPSKRGRRRGRPVGARRVDAVADNRLNILATLKAAAPWQTMRNDGTHAAPRRLQIRKEDLHVTRYKERVGTTTVFAVDASGSLAAQRLAEAKGAVELLLNDCYVRRDEVALVAFRGDAAEILLPPTRALARVKRSLAAMPGGGGTPLATGIDTTRGLAESIARQGRTPAIVLMTDGRANIARNGEPGAAGAEEEALAAGELLKLAGFRSLLVDTSRRPRPRARALADAMGAHYVPLPRADAAMISTAVRGYVS